MARSTNNPWLHRFAVAAAMATLFLIWVGGLVTSRGAGMAVPDWPTTYGYNMFLFPISKWTGGIFYEHSHRLVASGVGLLTVILAVWLWLKESRTWLRKLGLLAVFLVVGQGVLGGLRVTAMKDELGIFHATLAQLFLVLLSAIALFTSRWWNEAQAPRPLLDPGARSGRLQLWIGSVAVLILVQLILGASMRHQHAGLAIPDFPAAYGRFWPPTDDAAIARYNQQRGEVDATNSITAGQIHLQMAHRAVAILILAGVIWVAVAFRKLDSAVKGETGIGRLRAISVLWMVLIFLQAVLGALTIWTNKAADVATAHVALGALGFVTGSLLFLMVKRIAPESVPADARAVDRLEKLRPGALKA
jgi:heme a synthase